jgi:hypothetical protein
MTKFANGATSPGRSNCRDNASNFSTRFEKGMTVKPQSLIGMIAALHLVLAAHAPKQWLPLYSPWNLRALGASGITTQEARSPKRSGNVVERWESRLGNIDIVATASFHVDLIRGMCAEQQIGAPNRWRPTRFSPTDSRAQRLLSSVVERTVIIGTLGDSHHSEDPIKRP